MINYKNCVIISVAAILVSFIAISTNNVNANTNVTTDNYTNNEFYEEVNIEANIRNIIQNVESTENTTTEDTDKNETTKKKTIKKTTEKNTEETQEAYQNTIYPNVTGIDFDNLCKIIEAEAANQGETGKMLVANVVINRMKSSEFPNTITKIIFEQGQFQPTWDGSFYSVNVSDETVEIAKRALLGEDHSNGALYFACETSSASYFNTKLTFLYKHKAHYFYK